MYESHFGLTSRPFAETIAPAAYVPLSSSETALRRLRYGLERGTGPGLLYGPPGSGKTLLARRLLDDLGRPAVHLAFPAMSATELLAFLADELAAPADPAPGLAGSVRRVRTALAEAASRGAGVVLVVDEAHLIEAPATFEALRLLLNFATTGVPDLTLLLVGAPEIALSMPPALADRLGARCLLGPLTEVESADYLLGRLAAAGAGPDPLFDAATCTALHRAADGLPRRLNRLADLALLITYARDLLRPDVAAVAAAEREAGFDSLAA